MGREHDKMKVEHRAAPAGSAAANRPSRRRKRRWLRILIVLLGLVILLVWLAPYLLSTSLGTALITGIVNGRVHGRIQLQDVSLSWLGPCRLAGLVVVDPENREVLRVDAIALEKGVLSAAVSWEDIGRVEVGSPRAVLYLDQEGQTSLARAFRPRRGPSEPGPLPKPKGSIRVQEGTVRVVRPDGRSYEATQVDCLLELNTLSSVSGSLSVELPGGGRVRNVVALQGLVAGGRLSPDSVTGRFSSTTDSPLDLAPLGAFALGQGAMGGKASWKVDATLQPGRTGGHFEADLVGLEAAHLSGLRTEPVDVKLAASLDRTAAQIKGWLEVGGQVGQLRADLAYSPSAKAGGSAGIDPAEVLSAIAEGRPISLPDFKVTVNGKLNAALARAVPALMGIRPDVKITAGELRFEELTLVGGRQPSGAGRLELSGLTALAGERELRWDPIVAEFDVGDTPGGLAIRLAKLRSAFAEAAVTGTPQDLTGDFKTDLGLLHARLREVFALGPFELEGKAEGKLKLTRAGNRLDLGLTAGGDGLRYAVGGGPQPATGRQPGPRRELSIARVASGQKGHLTFEGGKLRRFDLDESQVTIDGVGELAATGWYDFTGKDFGGEVGLKQVNLSGLQGLLGSAVDMAGVRLGGNMAGSVKAQGRSPGRIDFEVAAAADSLEFGSAGAANRGTRRSESTGKTAKVARVAIAQKGYLEVGQEAVGKVVVADATIDADGAFLAGGSGWFDPRQGTFQFRMKLDRGDLAYAGRQAKALGFEQLARYSGVLAVQAEASRPSGGPSGGEIVSAGEGRVSGLKVDGANVAGGKDATFSWSDVRFSPKERLLSAVAARLDSALANLAASDLRCRMGEQLVLDGQVKLEAADLGALLAAARPFAGWREPPAVAGRLSWSGTARTAGSTCSLSGEGGISEFRYRSGPGVIREDSVRFAHDAQVDWQQQSAALRRFEIDSKAFSTRLAGTIQKYGSTGLLDLTGRYEASWDQLTPLIHVFAPQTADLLSFAGATASEVRVTGPANRPQVRPIYRGVQAAAKVGWESGRAYGVELGKAELSPALRDGQVQLPVVAVAAGEGKIRLGGTVDFRSDEPVLTIPGGTRILEDVPVNAELGKHLLSRINPIFSELDLGQAQGKVSLLVEELALPLGPRLRREGSGAGHLDLTGMEFVPRGLLGELLGLGGLSADGSQTLKVSGVDFVIKDGRVHYDNFVMTFAESFDLKFRGSVGFDDMVDMAVSIPVRSALLKRLGVSGVAAEVLGLLEGMRVDIPVVGTRARPRLDLSKVDLRPLIQRALRSFAEQEASRRVGEILRPKGPTGPASQPATGPTTQPGPQPPPKTPEEQVIDSLFKLLQDRLEGEKPK